jgi:hypothetical protein
VFPRILSNEDKTSFVALAPGQQLLCGAVDVALHVVHLSVEFIKLFFVATGV